MKRTITINGKEEVIKARGTALADRRVTTMAVPAKKGKGSMYKRNAKHKNQRQDW